MRDFRKNAKICAVYAEMNRRDCPKPHGGYKQSAWVKALLDATPTCSERNCHNLRRDWWEGIGEVYPGVESMCFSCGKASMEDYLLAWREDIQSPYVPPYVREEPFDVESEEPEEEILFEPEPAYSTW